MAENRHVHKFGGSSLADASCFRRVAGIVRQHSQAHDLIVVSAAGKTTNHLLQIIELTQNAEPIAAAELLLSLLEFQRSLANELLKATAANAVLHVLDQHQQQLAELLEGELNSYIINDILSFGERWSACLLAALLSEMGSPTGWLDSRQFFCAELSSQPQVNTELSTPKLQDLLAKGDFQRYVVTGFIARDSEGRSVTLGRNGSDYSATELAALVDAVSTTIWSDVAGIYSADPRLVKDARLQDKLALNEAAELSRIGTSVLHARTLEPLARSRQRLSLRCSYAPEDGQTQIHRQKLKPTGAKIVSSVDDIVLVELVIGDNFTDNCRGLLERLEQVQLAPVTRHKHAETGLLRLAYTQELIAEAVDAIDEVAEQFSVKELQSKQGYCLVALVGAGVSDNPQQCYRFFQHLTEQPLEFIHTCDDKLSLCAVLRKVSLEPLMKELHAAMFKPARKLGLVVFGKGNIGSRWLKLYAEQAAKLEQQYNLTLTLAGLYNKEGGMLDFSGIDPLLSEQDFLTQAVFWPELLDKLNHHPYDELVVLDITASEALSAYYPEFAKAGLHLITANKYAGAADSAFYQGLKQTFGEHGGHWHYNATVGAGLPVQASIQMLQQAGDQVQAISGIFSGTLSWLFQQYDGSVPFSQLLEQAWQQGLTEPDPREDLSGNDVQRKLLILAREAGYELELSDISLQSLVPAELQSLSLDAFLESMVALDASMAEALAEAQQDQLVIRYVASINRRGEAKVGLKALDPSHPFANLKPCDNVFAIESSWYKQNPLVIQGPGAGRAVTAGALQADLVSLCQKIT